MFFILMQPLDETEILVCRDRRLPEWKSNVPRAQVSCDLKLKFQINQSLSVNSETMAISGQLENQITIS